MQEITVCMLLGKKKKGTFTLKQWSLLFWVFIIINVSRQELFLLGKLKYFHEENTWHVG